MILYVQITIISILILILISLYREEHQKKKTRIPTGKLTQVWDGTERRRYVRISMNVPIRYSLPKGPNNPKNAKTKDISIGGLCMVTNEKLNPKTRLCLEIQAADDPRPILAKGEAIWIKENTEQRDEEGIRYFNVGVEFKDILPKDKERFLKFIKESEKNGQN